MDANRFDALTRALSAATRSRRGALAAALGGSLGLLGLAHPDSATAGGACKPACSECQTCQKGKCHKTKHGKKCKRGHCRPLPDGTVCASGNCRAGSCSTCANGVKNGTETDVDCGGVCARCANARTCSSRNDCAGALCTGGKCKECVVNTECGTDGNGECVCLQPEDVGPYVCTTNVYTGPFTSCAPCGPGTFCYISKPTEIYCYSKLCGA